MFRAVSLMACLLLGIISTETVHAAVITIEGTVKSVDAQKRTITVQTKNKMLELDVSRKVKVSVKGKTAKLDSLKPGQKVKISYHDGLEIVLKIEASARGESQVELLELSELNEGAYAASPWLSSDGLTIYWARGDWDTSGVVWTAKRKDANSFFRGKKQLFPGRSPTLTEDGLQMVFLGTRSDGEKGLSLHFTRRNSIDEPFKRPREIQELQGVQRPLSPSMSPDGLTLYLNRGGFGTPLRMEIVVCSRAKREAPWGKPQSLPIMLDNIEKGVLTGAFITSDELSMYCVIEGRGKDRKQDNLMLWTRTSKSKRFSNFTYLTDGLPRMTCSTPRYVKATNELFVSRLISPSQLRLFVIKGFIPRSATTP